MVVLNDFLAAVNQIAAERGIDPDDVFDAIEEAIRTGYKKSYGTGESLVVEIDRKKGELKVFADKKVAKRVTNSATQISLENARKIEPKLKAGDHLQVDITPEGEFGRIAVQAAKQVILQKVREAEKDAVMKEFKGKMGTVESGIVQRMDGDSVIIEIRKATAVMPAEERLPGEYYKSGARLKFLLKKILKTVRGKQLIVTRSDPEFLRELFAMEVPEIRSESVEIKAVAREAGSRSKVAVVSNQEGVDPIGACVGQKGIRIDNITDELKGEKIDIIIWDEDLEIFIGNSLSPAQVNKIKLDKKEKIANVIVPDDQLSLAIGKDGQNVRLAAKLTGWKIDIEGETIKPEDESEDTSEEKKGEKKSSKKKSKEKKEKKSTKSEKKSTKKKKSKEKKEKPRKGTRKKALKKTKKKSEERKEKQGAKSEKKSTKKMKSKEKKEKPKKETRKKAVKKKQASKEK